MKLNESKYVLVIDCKAKSEYGYIVYLLKSKYEADAIMEVMRNIEFCDIDSAYYIFLSKVIRKKSNGDTLTLEHKIYIDKRNVTNIERMCEDDLNSLELVVHPGDGYTNVVDIEEVLPCNC